MNNQQVLEKAIQKAIDGGYQIEPPALHVYEDSYGVISIGYLISADDNDQTWFSDDYDVLSVNDLIFNRDFAKALWGEKTFNMQCNVCYFIHELYDRHQFGLEITEPWIFHLTEMVIADDPIKYLGENI